MVAFPVIGVYVCSCRSTDYYTSTSSIETVFTVSILLSIIGGIGSSILWVAFNRYIEEICRRCASRSFIYCSTFYGILSLSLFSGIGIFYLIYYTMDFDAAYNANLIIGVAGCLIFALIPFAREGEKSTYSP